MFDAAFQRTLPARLPMLREEFGISAMGGVGGWAGMWGMDAQPALTTQPNSGIPQWMLNYIDPDILRILFSPLKAAKIIGERKTGDWTTATATFPIVEVTGMVTSYGDFNDDGSAGANTNFPQRQSYHFQTILQYGEREVDVVSRAKINLVGEKKEGATRAVNQYGNLSYFYGIKGLQNYGLLNDPNLTAPLTPGTKAYNGGTGTAWIVNGVIMATANEIFADIQSMYIALVNQANGIVELDKEVPLVLAMSPEVQVALTATNEFNVNVFDLLKKNFPNIRFETAVQYSTNAGQLVQLIADMVEGQQTAYAAFTEKLRAHTIVRGLSSWRQKVSQGTWGAIIRQPFAIVQMLGV